MKLKWLGYNSRTYQAIRNDLIAGVRTLIPEMTDLSDNNVLVRMLALISGVAEQLHYQLDRTVRESFAGTAQSYRSVLDIARKRGVSVPLANPAQVVLNFTSDAPAPAGGQLIPANTVCVSPGTGLIYRTTQDATILAGQTTATVLARQSVPVSTYVAQDLEGAQKASATGLPNEGFYLPANVVQGSIRMFVDGEEWSYTRAQAVSSTTLSDAKHFYVSLDKSFRTLVYVGDGFMGSLLDAGATVLFSYDLTQAEAGNLAADTITVIQSSVTLASGITSLSVTNQSAAYGGRTIMEIDTLRNYVQNYNLTDNSAVLLSDIRARVLTIGDVVDASVRFEPNCTVVVDLLTRGGETLPVTTLQDAFDDATDSILTMGLTAIVRLVQAVQINILLRINYSAGADEATVRAAVQDALTDYMAIGSRRIGVPIYNSDLFQVIEAVDGVDNSEILSLVGVADFVKTYDTASANNSTLDASIVDTSGTLAEWSIVHVEALGGVNTYQVIVNGVYTGQVVTSTGLPGTLTNQYGTITINHSNLSSVGSTWLYYVSVYDGNKLLISSGVYPQLGTLTIV